MKFLFSLLTFLIITIVTIIAYYAFESGYIWFVYPSKDKYPIRGIDVSNHQGKINWKEIPKSEVFFVYMKATEGGDFQDKSFSYNWSEAKKAGFPVGAYHFFTLCRSGKDQADNFIRTVPKELDSLPPVIDLEFLGNCKERPRITNVQNEIQIFLDKIDSHYQKKTILYLTNEFINAYLENNLFNHPIWIRSIYMHPEYFFHKDWLIWQYKSRGNIPGIQGPVDLNVFNGKWELLTSSAPKE